MAAPKGAVAAEADMNETEERTSASATATEPRLRPTFNAFRRG
jgi:hypothetical protein